jgi:hypothetical protein
MKTVLPETTSSSACERARRERRGVGLALAVLLWVLFGAGHGAEAQQFNTDNYLAMPHGTGTFVLTHGQNYSMLLNSFALFPTWEFFAGATLYWTEDQRLSTDSFSTSFFVKKMFYENEAKNGGFAVMGGTGEEAPAFTYSTRAAL